jgi:HK97 family phage major capsid protein
MAHNIRRIMHAASSMPWAILPEKLEAIFSVLTLRASGGRVSDDDIAIAAASNRKPAARTSGAIAVIPVYGVLSQRMDMMSDMSGGTSTESLAKAFDQAMADPDVGAVVFDIDSPGGTVQGIQELATKIASARGTKPIKAVSNALCASAAYWIASACDDITVTPSGSVGSIGVFMVHCDTSGMDAAEGVKYTMVSAGKYKTEANQYEPLSDEARASLQGQVDQFYEMFVGSVAKNRGVSASAVKSGYGEGRVLLAKEAVKAGMADKVATLDQVLSSLGASRGTAVRSARADAAPLELVASAEPTLPDGQRLVAYLESTWAGDPTAKVQLTSEQISAFRAQLQRQTDLASPIRTELVPTSSAGGAAADDPSLPAHLSAPVAKEHPVSEHTAAHTGAAPSLETDNKMQAFLELAQMQGKSISDVTDWVTAGKTPEQVRAELAAEQKGRTTPLITNVHDRAAERKFGTLGEQMVAIMRAGSPGGRTDPRLKQINSDILAGTPSGMNESVGSEGGFYIQPDLLTGVIEPVYVEDPLISRVKRIPISAASNGVKYNVVDESARTNGNRWGGIQAFWGAEADTEGAKKPKLRQMALQLHKIIGVAYLTDELLTDAPAAESLITDAFQAELSFMLGDSIFRGTGAGQPQGFMNSGALVTQAIEATQTIANSGQFISLNVTKMLSRVPASLWNDCIWMYNQELLPYLVNATIGTTTSVPVFMAIGGLANKPYDTILGRPAFASELPEAVGTPGDLVLLAPSQYHMADKGGPTIATSVHVRFLYDEMAMRITYRTDGAPVWRTSVTPYKGANPRSPFVALAVRV